MWQWVALKGKVPCLPTRVVHGQLICYHVCVCCALVLEFEMTKPQHPMPGGSRRQRTRGSWGKCVKSSSAISRPFCGSSVAQLGKTLQNARILALRPCSSAQPRPTQQPQRGAQ